jgi:hypothetical protein
MTVRTRRSGDCAAAGARGASGLAANSVPQSPQNRLPAGFSLPQALHCQGSGVPQLPQNILWSATGAAQRGQIMHPPFSADGRDFPQVY